MIRRILTWFKTSLIFSVFGASAAFYGTMLLLFNYFAWPYALILDAVVLVFAVFMVRLLMKVYAAKQVHMKNKGWDGKKGYT